MLKVVYAHDSTCPVTYHRRYLYHILRTLPRPKNEILLPFIAVVILQFAICLSTEDAREGVTICTYHCVIINLYTASEF